MHQVGDQTKVILRCTVNQPSRSIIQSNKSSAHSGSAVCCVQYIHYVHQID
jgi:hypothetical protein